MCSKAILSCAYCLTIRRTSLGIHQHFERLSKSAVIYKFRGGFIPDGHIAEFKGNITPQIDLKR